MELSKLSVEDIRKMVSLLRDRPVKPLTILFRGEIRLEDGIIFIGDFGAMHPAAFLEIFGADALRELPRDVSLDQLEEFITKHT